jgi:hypothetical protein
MFLGFLKKYLKNNNKIMIGVSKKISSFKNKNKIITKIQK